MRPQEPPPSPHFFPDPRSGVGPHGIVRLGADFAPGTLLSAYRQGIFPWPVSEELVPWCSPDPRAVFLIQRPKRWSRSLRRSLRKKPFRVSTDQAFRDVMLACADRDQGTWITEAVLHGFCELHRLGWAHSIEVWNRSTNALVGGLYGVCIGGMFAGESMFHRETDASKVAFARLVELLRARDFHLLDVQQLTPHLESLGCVAIHRSQFLRHLAHGLNINTTFPEPTAELIPPSE